VIFSLGPCNKLASVSYCLQIGAFIGLGTYILCCSPRAARRIIPACCDSTNLPPPKTPKSEESVETDTLSDYCLCIERVVAGVVGTGPVALVHPVYDAHTKTALTVRDVPVTTSIGVNYVHLASDDQPPRHATQIAGLCCTRHQFPFHSPKAILRSIRSGARPQRRDFTR
jgi:hypothetical protein